MSFPNSVNLSSDINSQASANDIVCETLQCSVKLFSGTIECDEIKAGTVSNISVSNDLDLGTNNLTCNTLNYTSLNPPISGGAPVWGRGQCNTDVLYSSSGGYQQLIFTDDIVTDGMTFDSGSQRFIIGSNGVYQINFRANIGNGIGGTDLYCFLSINPSSLPVNKAQCFSNIPNSIVSTNFTWTGSLLAGQEIGIFVISSGANGAVLSYCSVGPETGSSYMLNIVKI